MKKSRFVLPLLVAFLGFAMSAAASAQITLMFGAFGTSSSNNAYYFGNASTGMPFDYSGDGSQSLVPWPNPAMYGTGWLVLGRWDGDPPVFKASIYGDHMAEGTPGKTGFENLADQCDANHDGVIDQNDPCFGSLGFWFDGINGLPLDGQVQFTPGDPDNLRGDGEFRKLSGTSIGGLCIKRITLPNSSSFTGKRYPFGGPCNKGVIQFDRGCSSAPKADLFECRFDILPTS